MTRRPRSTAGLRWLFLLASALVLTACTTEPPVTPAVTAVEITEGDQTLSFGDTVQLTATVTAVGGASEALTWSSDDDTIATVDATGLVTATGAGTATITATSDFDDTVSDGITVTVTPLPEVTAVAIDQDDQTLTVGDTVQLTATVTAVGGASEALTWSSDDDTIATVDATGLVTAIAVGTATITATSDFNPAVSDGITVTVTEAVAPAVTAVAIDQDDQTLTVGDTVQLTATVTAVGGASEALTWSSDDDTIATVDATGLVTAIAVGTATITATSDFNPAVSDGITVTVTPLAEVTAVAIDQDDQTLTVGDTVQLTATVTAVGGASEALTWSSDDDTIATVDATGLVTATGAGTATITATSDFDDTVSDGITVTVTQPDLDDLYVDDSAEPDGDGSFQRPLQTINEALAIVNPGGRINVAAGTYAESLFIDDSVEIVGAGASQVTVVSTSVAAGPDSAASIAIAGADGVTLEGFTLQTDFPDPVDPFTPEAVAAVALYGSPSNVTLRDLVVDHDGGTNGIHGVSIFFASDILLEDVAVIDRAGAGGAGIRLVASSDVTMTGISTTGHTGFAGVSIAMIGQLVSNVSLSGTFSEVAKLDVDLRQVGSQFVGFDAPQFTHVVRSSHPDYFFGDVWFYKESEAVAVLDSLYNFFDGVDGALSYIQLLDPIDQSVALNTFIVSGAEGTPYGLPGEIRYNGIQAAIDAAAPGAQVLLRAGIFDGPIDVDVSGLDLSGEGAASVLTADVGPVVTIGADDVTISGIQIESGDDAQLGVLVDDVTGFAIGQSNLLTDPALQNVGGNVVDAQDNFWGAADGPSGDGPGTGNALLDPGADVDVTPVAATPFP